MQVYQNQMGEGADREENSHGAWKSVISMDYWAENGKKIPKGHIYVYYLMDEHSQCTQWKKKWMFVYIY